MAQDPDDPGFTLTLDTDSGGLVARVAGRIDGVDALAAMFLRIAGELRRTGLDRLLVLDHTFGVVPTEDQWNRLFAAIEGRGFAEVRVAYVDGRGTAVSRMEMGEIMGREHGYQCRVFDNEHRARIWLDYGEQ